MQILSIHFETERLVNKRKYSNNRGTEHHRFDISNRESHSVGICTVISTVGSESEKCGFACEFYFKPCKQKLFSSRQNVFTWNKTSPVVQITSLQGFFLCCNIIMCQ